MALWEIVSVKKKKIVYIIWGLKNIIFTLDDYLLSCGFLKKCFSKKKKIVYLIWGLKKYYCHTSREGTIPSKKAPIRRRNARNCKREQLGEEKAQNNNGGEKEKVKKKEKRKEVWKLNTKKLKN